MQDSWNMNSIVVEIPLPLTTPNPSPKPARLDGSRMSDIYLVDWLNQPINSMSDQDWQNLSGLAVDLIQLLGLFAPTPISWSLVDMVVESLGWSQPQIDQIRIQFHGSGLLQFTDAGYCIVEPSARKQLQAGRANVSQINQLKQKFAAVMASIAKQILTDSLNATNWDLPVVMPHLAEAAQNMTIYFSDESVQYCFLALGSFCLKQKSYEEAKNWYTQCLSLSLERFGSVHPAVATSLNNLAHLYSQQGRFEQAASLYEKALDLCQQVFGSNHLNVAISLNNLASLYNLQGCYKEAEVLCQEALQLKKQLLGESHPSLATSLNNLAGVYYNQGQYDQAKMLYFQALRLRQCLLGRNHARVAMSLSNLASVFYAQGKLQRAIATSKQALHIAEQSLGKDHPETISLQQNLQMIQEVSKN